MVALRTCIQSLPGITAVMPTSGIGIRRQYAQVAIACFQRQTYAERSLLVLNHGDRLFPDGPPDSNIREVMVERPKTLGELRNLAFPHLHTSYFITWDDDDWHHPERIAVQHAHLAREDAGACILDQYLTLDVMTGVGFLRQGRSSRCKGCCGTILARVTDIRYPARDRHEDGDFALAYRAQGCLCVVEAPDTLYIRTCHDGNRSGRSHILRRGDGRAPLSAKTQKFLKKVRDDFETIGGIVIPSPEFGS